VSGMTVVIIAAIIVGIIFVIAGVIDFRDRGRFNKGTRFRPAMSRRQMRQSLRPTGRPKTDERIRQMNRKRNGPKFWN
jgi:hypothetical protein